MTAPTYTFPLPTPVTVPVARSEALFPVRRVYCVGRNYAAHAREMGFDERELPFFFCKPNNSIVTTVQNQTSTIAYPSQSTDFQHEIELVVAIGRGGSNITVAQAERHIFGYAMGLDMTRRDLQLAARDKGRPWELGKAFDQSAPIGTLYPAALIGHLGQGEIWVQVDGVDRQRSDINKLIWTVPEVICSFIAILRTPACDLIFTGTPEGVGKVECGQTLLGGIDGLGTLQVKVI